MQVLEIIKTLWGLFGKTAKDSAQTLFADRRVAFLVAAFFVLLSGALGWWTLSRADYYQRIVDTALAKSTENTPQTFKALEALILTEVERGPDGRQIDYQHIVSAAKMSSNFKRVIEEFDRALSSESSAAPKPLEVASPEIDFASRNRAQEAIITEQNGDPDLGFLFLPARILHLSRSSLSGAAAGDDPKLPSEKIAKLLKIRNEQHKGSSAVRQVCDETGPSLCDDVLVSRELIQPLHKATSLPVTNFSIPFLDTTPQQAYLITDNGVNRIVGNTGHDSSFYRNQFKASTVFPARPYYVGAFGKAVEGPGKLLEKDPSGQPLQSYFYVSEPYLDIGGNGIVITLSRAYKYDDHTEGAICFDLTLLPGNALAPKLETMLTKLGGSSVAVTCGLSRVGSTVCHRTDPKDKGDASLFTSVVPKLTSKLRKEEGESNTSDVSGGFAILQRPGSNDDTSQAGVTSLMNSLIAHESDELQFTVPLGAPTVTDVRQSFDVPFLVASLDVGSFLTRTSIAGAFALSCLGIALTILIGSWATDAQLSKASLKEKKDLSEALDNVSKVMLSAATPYVLLDSEDHLIHGNPALAAFLGFPATQESVSKSLENTKFADWLADDSSRREYRRVQTLRSENETVDPYRLNFSVQNGPPRNALIVSSYVPATQTSKGTLPKTFGIFV